MKESSISTIIDLEWEMFSNVSNVGGPASCQLDPKTFGIMRRSQIAAWPEELLKSYLDDLTAARREGRNLMSEKYARMMESTFPAEYREIADRLPRIDQATLALIEDIVSVNIGWKQEMADRYPVLNGKGRPIHTKDDTHHVTSFETYFRGELKTYSPKTIRLFHEHIKSQKKNGVNEAELNLLNQVKGYGYTSLAEAEKNMAR